MSRGGCIAGGIPRILPKHYKSPFCLSDSNSTGSIYPRRVSTRGGFLKCWHFVYFFSLTKYGSMEYLKGSYSISKGQGLAFAPPGSPNKSPLGFGKDFVCFLISPLIPPRNIPPPGSPKNRKTEKRKTEKLKNRKTEKPKTEH